ncbi:hypothetical protein EVAR_73826_1 [Eumeta japonica]|uniref:Uncharacterized protein n=1 Tax=Eumeta variegata TaxID=151549 RepID=A0A4C1SZ64_EUMVA|nr:hypothetical protein EVAR_73826_1 [Eumeta japonica]
MRVDLDCLSIITVAVARNARHWLLGGGTFLGRHMFSDLCELSESRIGDLLKYLTATGDLGNGVPIFKEKAYGCAIGLLFEPYPRVIISVSRGWCPGVTPKEKLRQLLVEVLVQQKRGAVAYQQTVLEIPGRVVAVKLRHDAHLFGMPLEGSRAEIKLARNS